MTSVFRLRMVKVTQNNLSHNNCLLRSRRVFVWVKMGTNAAAAILYGDSSFKDTMSFPVSILHKSIVGRYRPVRVANGPITARYMFM